MRKSRFKLDRLMKLKRVEEYKTYKQLANISLQKEWVNDRIVSLQEEIERTQQALRDIKDFSQYLVVKNYLYSLDTALKGLEIEQERLKSECALKQKQVEMRRGERKIIENISRRYYNECQKQQRKIDG